MGVMKKRKKRQTNLTLDDVKKLKVQKVLIYDRISSEMQEKFGKGIETQEYEIMNWMKIHLPNAEVVGILTDRAESAFSIPLKHREKGKELYLNTPNWKRYADGKPLPPNALVFNIVLVFIGSRLFRNNEESTLIYSFFEENDIFVISTSDNSLNTFIGGTTKTLRQMKDIMYEADSESKSINMLASKNYGRANGRFTGGGLPYGFYWDKVNKKIVQIDEQVEVYKLIIKKYLYEGKGTVVIARELNENGKAFVDNKRGNTSQWTSNNVRDLLTNPILTGRLQYKKYIEVFDVEKGRIVKKKRDILDEEFIKPHNDLKEHIPYEKWREVVHKLASKNNRYNDESFSPRTYLLTSFVQCPHCSSIMQGENKGNSRIYYYCKNNLCKGYPKSFPKEKLEKEVLSQIKEYLSFNKEDIEEIKIRMEKFLTLQADNKNEISYVEEEIKSLSISLENLENQYKESLRISNSQFSFNEYIKIKEEMFNILQEKQMILNELKIENNARENLDENLKQAFILIENLFNLVDNYSEVNLPLYRNIVKFLVKEIKMVEGKMKVIFNEVFDERNILSVGELFNDEVSATSELLGTHSEHIHEYTMYPLEVFQSIFSVLNTINK
jgi:hypothetical protein